MYEINSWLLCYGVTVNCFTQRNDLFYSDVLSQDLFSKTVVEGLASVTLENVLLKE